MTESEPHYPLDDVEPAEPARPSRGARVFFGLSLVIFVVGGLFFGAVLLSNLKALSEHGRQVRLELPVAGPVTIALVPQVLQLPQIPQIAGLPLPQLPSSLPQIGPTTVLPEWQGSKPIGLLLLGVDKREEERIEHARADTMLLLVIHPRQKAAAMISLPRDLWVPIPGYGQQRINVAHALGGPVLAKKTVEHNFGVPVDYFARIDFQAFEEVVDALGGVLVDVERPIQDDEYPVENYGLTRIYIAPGPQVMDGLTALRYVRSRHSENDFGRMRRQQRFLVALRDRALQLNVLPRVPSLLGLVQRTVATDLGPTQILALARLAWEIDQERIGSLVLDARHVSSFRSEEGADLLMPEPQAIRAAVRDVLAQLERSD